VRNHHPALPAFLNSCSWLQASLCVFSMSQLMYRSSIFCSASNKGTREAFFVFAMYRIDAQTLPGFFLEQSFFASL
jgi:hypothetical protein